MKEQKERRKIRREGGKDKNEEQNRWKTIRRKQKPVTEVRTRGGRGGLETRELEEEM